MPGNRQAEFRARTPPDELIALVDKARADAHGWLAAMDRVEPGAARASYGVNDKTGNVSAAYCVVDTKRA